MMIAKKILLTALLLVVAVECFADQKNKISNPEPVDSAASVKIISILPPKGIIALADEQTAQPIQAQGSAAFNEKSTVTELANKGLLDNMSASFFKTRGLQSLELAAVVSFIGTIFVLILVARKKQRQPIPIIKEQKLEPIVIRELDKEQEESENLRLKQSISAIIRDEAAIVSQYVRRNRGEFHLAMKFQEQQSANRLAAKIGKTRVQNPIGVAKQTGVGKGEVELAFHLNEIQQSRVQMKGAR